MSLQIEFKRFPFWHRLLLRLPEPEEGSVYIVGGWVRDLLFFGQPCNLELDWSVSGNAIEWGRRIAARFHVPVLSESALGTSRLVVEHEGVSIRFDLASCRREYYPSPGDLPVVSPALIEEDLERRDFSINAMAIAVTFPVPEQALLLDPLGGIEDLARKRLRILHPDSFYEDPTRIFRLFRFQQRMGLVLSRGTEDALVRARDSCFLSSVSRSRLWDEVRNMVAEPDPLPIVFEWLARVPWGTMLPSLRSTGPRRLRLIRWLHLRQDVTPFLRNGKYNPELLFLLAFLYGISRKEFQRATSLFGVPDRVKERIRETLFQKNDRGVFHLFEERCAEEEGGWWREAGRIPLESAYLLAIRSPVERIGFWKKFFRASEESPTLLTGDDLLREGVSPSAFLSELLSEVRNLQRSGKLRSRGEALMWVRNRLGPSSPGDSG